MSAAAGSVSEVSAWVLACVTVWRLLLDSQTCSVILQLAENSCNVPASCSLKKAWSMVADWMTLLVIGACG